MDSKVPGLRIYRSNILNFDYKRLLKHAFGSPKVCPCSVFYKKMPLHWPKNWNYFWKIIFLDVSSMYLEMQAWALNCRAALMHKLLTCYEEFRRLSIVFPGTSAEVFNFNTTSLKSNSVIWSVTSCGEMIINCNFPWFAFMSFDLTNLLRFHY